MLGVSVMWKVNFRVWDSGIGFGVRVRVFRVWVKV